MNYVELPAPHGFLIWRGKQTLIASDKPIEPKELMVVSNDEAFGTAILSSKPAILDINTFDLEQYSKEHRVSPEERRLYFPDATNLYVSTRS